MCRFCSSETTTGKLVGKDYDVKPCGNGDMGARAQFLDGGIVLYVDKHIAYGYFDINYCPICGRQVNTALCASI